MTHNKIIPYNPILRERARKLRNNSTLTEVILWKLIKNKALGVQFHRQVPLANYIIDFYCHELSLAIEIDGSSHDSKFLYDAHRQNKLESIGITIIRFTNSEIEKNNYTVVQSILKKIEEMKRE